MDPDPLLSRATRYTTLAAGTEAVAELEIKRSRFLAVLRRAPTEAEARALAEELRRGFHDARHHCSAFVLGPDGATVRSNDDGEPAGVLAVVIETTERLQTERVENETSHTSQTGEHTHNSETFCDEKCCCSQSCRIISQ